MQPGGPPGKNNMKVLLINSVCGIGSTGKIVGALAEEFTSQGHQAVIAYGRDGTVPERYRCYAHRIGSDLGVKVSAVRTRLLDDHGFANESATRKFLKWAESYDPDLIWLHNLHGYYIHVGLLFDWIKSRPHMQVKWTLHDCWAFTGHCAHFLAAGCDFTCRIVVNPCWVPSEELPKVGYTGYLEDYKSLEQYWGEETKTIDTELCIGCFAPADELLGTKYMEEFKKHFKEVYEIPGGHHISEEAARKIMTEIVPMAIKKFRKPGAAADIVRNGLNEEDLFKYAHRLSIYNKPSIMKSKICGCFYCGKIYPATSIRSFIDKGTTALCPHCGMDSVIADADWKDLTREFLEKMHIRFFG